MEQKNKLLELVQKRIDGDTHGYMRQLDKHKKTPAKVEKKKAPAQEKEILAANKTYRDALAYVKDAISPAFMQIWPDKIQVNNTIAKTFFVYAYPNFLE